MGLTNSELLEELLLKCYNENIINEVRKDVFNLLKTNALLTQYEAYEIVYKKLTKNN